MHPKLANRLLAHSIDAATPRSRKRGNVWPETLAMLAVVGVAIALLLWADRTFV